MLPASLIQLLLNSGYAALHEVLECTEGKLKNIRRIPAVGAKKARVIKAALDEIGS